MHPDTLTRIGRTLTRIEQKLTEPLTMTELARCAGYSLWHYQRLFAAIVGEPPGAYLRRRRLTEAARLLRAQPKLRILDAALTFQFESHEAFTRAFQTMASVTPRQYRHGADVCLWQRPALPASTLQLPSITMQIQPILLDLPAFKLFGHSSRFISAASPDANNMKVIPPLWRRVNSERPLLQLPEGAVAFGASRCLPAAQRTREDELEYLAGFEWAEGRALRPSMVTWKIPAQRYACFTHVGAVEAFHQTLMAIYGHWFPRSEYEPALGTEIERYDHRFSLTSPKSELEYLVPIRQRGK